MRAVSESVWGRRLFALMAFIAVARPDGASAQGEPLVESFGAARAAIGISRVANPEGSNRFRNVADAALVCRRNVMDRSDACGGTALSARCFGRSTGEANAVFPKDAKLLALSLDYYPANSSDVERGIAVVLVPRAGFADYREALWNWGADLLEGRMPPEDPARVPALATALKDIAVWLDSSIGGTKRAFKGLLLPGDFVLAPQTRVAPDCGLE